MGVHERRLFHVTWANDARYSNVITRGRQQSLPVRDALRLPGVGPEQRILLLACLIGQAEV